VPQKPLGHVLNASGGVGAGVNCPSTTPRFFFTGGGSFFSGGTENFLVPYSPIFFSTNNIK